MLGSYRASSDASRKRAAKNMASPVYHKHTLHPTGNQSYAHPAAIAREMSQTFKHRVVWHDGKVNPAKNYFKQQARIQQPSIQAPIPLATPKVVLRKTTKRPVNPVKVVLRKTTEWARKELFLFLAAVDYWHVLREHDKQIAKRLDVYATRNWML